MGKRRAGLKAGPYERRRDILVERDEGRASARLSNGGADLAGRLRSQAGARIVQPGMDLEEILVDEAGPLQKAEGRQQKQSGRGAAHHAIADSFSTTPKASSRTWTMKSASDFVTQSGGLIRTRWTAGP